MRRIASARTPLVCEPADPVNVSGVHTRDIPVRESSLRVLGAMHERAKPELVEAAIR
jgi:hypothetical protein